MPPSTGPKSRKDPKLQHSRSRHLKRKRDIEDIESLAQRVVDFDCRPNALPTLFSELPLSQPTHAGLEASHFKKLTPIQAQSIPASLKGDDVLGSARTGSGKTLAFLLPVLENLYRKRWTEYDGLGALILSPTRELAKQIFDVLRNVGRNHTFSAGLVIGGKSLQEERDRLGRMNILVATPGRILQHMDQTADLDVGNLQMLVLDEADRIMDMGFQNTVDAIVEHLPQERQTLMFSATQTKKVSDLARLSLHNPEFVSVQEESENVTPVQLQQNYVVTPLAQKLDTLWSFLRSNTKKKILVFLSSGKQVRFVYEAFRHMQPGISLLHLHGRQKQSARLDITTKFSNSQYACLLSTDVAARGLDFPAVDWVVQVDCPEDADTYIHRVGRTARFDSSGRAVLFLDPSEEHGMLGALATKKVVGVEEIHVKPKKMESTIQSQLQNMCFKDPELKYLGQKAFSSYVRSVYIQKDKSIFDVKRLDLEAFATSLGLPGAPRVKFVKGEDIKRLKNMPRALAAMEDESDTDTGDGEDGETLDKEKSVKPKQVRTKYDRMFERRNQDVLADHYSKLIDDENELGTGNADVADADEDDDFMAVRTRYNVDDDRLDMKNGADPTNLRSEENFEQHDQKMSSPYGTDRLTSSSLPATQKTVRLTTNPDAKPLIIDSKRREKLLKSKKALLKYKGSGSHMVFDSDNEDDNRGHEKITYEGEEEFVKKGDAHEQRKEFLRGERQKAQMADEVDREVAKDKRREKKIKRKERERELEAEDLSQDDETGVQLAPYVEDNDNDPAMGKDDEDVQMVPKEKRKRKWFENAESGGDDDSPLDAFQKSKVDKKRHRRHGAVEDQQPQTLEDLEALASGLLAR